ncbi:MAG: hypothetical protein H6745_02620 [Deltaproteobacteria bacterium]|nr:hypothetical protein [Deltaproteobacteria bacterium]
MADPDEKAKDAAVDDDPMERALAALDGGLDGFEFIINADGSVTFVDFPPELLDVAYALNPDDPLVCERRALIAGEGGAGGGDSSDAD